MAKDEVIHIAHVAGVVDFLYSNPDLQDAYEFLQRFATLVATAERQPLTEEQIKAAVRHLYGSDAVTAIAVTGDIETARAIEAAHGITKSKQ